VRLVVQWSNRAGSQFSCQPTFWRRMMQWTTPAFTDLRFGFEITMYIANR
jgi:coenzyme PQQ precursor peptide PqqA